jgi:L-2-hydroxycarboxylate dehydrogenase (NAD+)
MALNSIPIAIGLTGSVGAAYADLWIVGLEGWMEEVLDPTLVNWDRAVSFASRALIGCGVPDRDAQRAAEALVDSDLHGTVTHGLKNLRGYVEALIEGRSNAKANVQDVGGGLAARVLDGDNGLGHVVGHYGMDRAIELAKEYGVGEVFVRNSNHYGASGYWARLALRHNMIGFAFTNATASIAPWGGKAKLIGNNPPAWVVPTRVIQAGEMLSPGDLDPVFLDIALSVVAGNRLDIYQRRGAELPVGWALDADGNPTTSAAARAAGGSYAPLGAYKGSGLATVLSMIASFLSGGQFDRARVDGQHGNPVPGAICHWFAAYDIGQFVDLEEFTASVRGLQSRVRAAEPRAGFERVLAPGDIENDKARRGMRDGIPIEQFTVDDLAWVAEQTGTVFDIV